MVDRPAQRSSPATAILEKCFARGEIDKDEFGNRKRLLSIWGQAWKPAHFGALNKALNDHGALQAA